MQHAVALVVAGALVASARGKGFGDLPCEEALARHEASITALQESVRRLEELVETLLPESQHGAKSAVGSDVIEADRFEGRSLSTTPNGGGTKVDGFSLTTQIVNTTELHVSTIYWNGREWSPHSPTHFPTTSPTSPSPAPTTAVPTATHSWDFRGCADGTPIVDSIGGSYVATGVGTTSCASFGMVLDGVTGYISIDSYSWGGTTSVEAYFYVNAGGGSTYPRLFDFGNGSPSDNFLSFHVSNSGGTIGFEVYVGSANRRIDSTALLYTAGNWVHFVGTVQGTNMAQYVNGALAASRNDGWEPADVSRTNQWLGKSQWGDGIMDGTYSFFRIWHGTELSALDASVLYKIATS